MSDAQPHDLSVEVRLDVMMFLQFFTWGAWFATLGLCLGTNGMGDFIGGAYGAAPIAAMVAPLFLGLIADRFFPSQVVMGVLLCIGGALLWMAPEFATPEQGKLLVALILGHLLCFMPTLGLGNTIAFANLSDQSAFPRVRVWGTIGWIVAGLVVGFGGWSASLTIFKLAGGSSLLLGLYSFTLPHTPPPARGEPLSWRTLLMADAFALMKSPPFFVFILCSTLICIPLAYYYAYTSVLLGHLGFPAAAATMTLGQMSEVFFMLLIPFFFRRLGVKWMILIGMAAWAVRYVLFAFGAADQAIWMVLLAVLLHGVCYDFFFVTGFMYTDQKAPRNVKGQAQSLLVFFTQGVGMFFGYMVADARFKATMGSAEELGKAIDAGRAGAAPLTPLQSFQQMFTVQMPESVSPELVTTTMQQWKEFWLLPAGMAAVILVVFAALFHDRVGRPVDAPSMDPEAAP